MIVVQIVVALWSDILSVIVDIVNIFCRKTAYSLRIHITYIAALLVVCIFIAIFKSYNEVSSVHFTEIIENVGPYQLKPNEVLQLLFVSIRLSFEAFCASSFRLCLKQNFLKLALNVITAKFQVSLFTKLISKLSRLVATKKKTLR